jgi:hypothetical protein
MAGVFSNNWVLHAGHLLSVVNYEKLIMRCRWCGVIHYSDHELVCSFLTVVAKITDLLYLPNNGLCLSVTKSNFFAFGMVNSGISKCIQARSKPPDLENLEFKWSCKYVTLVYIIYFCFLHKLLTILCPLYNRRTRLLRWEFTFCNVPLIARGSVMTSLHRTLDIMARAPSLAHGVELMKGRGVVGLRMWSMG